MPAPERATAGQRLAYLMAGIGSFGVIALLLWYTAASGVRHGILDAALVGGCGAGGVVLLVSALLGRKVRWK